jgi:hypothetical protein
MKGRLTTIKALKKSGLSCDLGHLQMMASPRPNCKPSHFITILFHNLPAEQIQRNVSVQIIKNDRQNDERK